MRIPDTWDDEVDVVVVGYGGAGAATAITAHDAGSEVLILEKAPKGEEGGNTRVSGNIWLTPEPEEMAATYMRAMCGEYAIPEEMVRAWAAELGKNNEWVRSLGGKPFEVRAMSREFPDLEGVECVHVYVNGSIQGNASLWKLLTDHVEKRGIKVLYGTAGKRLVQDPATREIIGVIAGAAGKEVSIKARKAVVLTCGGFENSPEMIRDYLTSLPHCYPKGTPYNTGDGIRMALDVGADLWHMQNIAGPQYSFRLPGTDVVMYPRGMPGNSYIYISSSAERFVFEQAYFVQTPEGLIYPVKHGKIWRHGQWVPSPSPPSMYCIFDENLRRKGPLYGRGEFKVGWVEILGLYTWSEDNSDEIEKGWITKADTLRELAEAIGLDPEKFRQTVERYNRCCAEGCDYDYTRDPNTLEPIGKPPYYALPLVPNFINTQGGPRRNASAQVVGPFGEPIARLYSSGELGSLFSFLYQGGGNVGECLAFGRIAGRNAAAEKPLH